MSGLYGQSATQAMQVKRLQEQSRSSIVRFVEDPAEQAAFQAEYHPGQDTPPVIDATFEVEAAHQPQRLEQPAPKPAPAPEPEGEELVLQQPPPAPSQITGLATFNAAMKQVGVRTKAQAQMLKEQLGLENVPDKELAKGDMQALYKQARSEWEAAQNAQPA